MQPASSVAPRATPRETFESRSRGLSGRDCPEWSRRPSGTSGLLGVGRETRFVREPGGVAQPIDERTFGAGHESRVGPADRRRTTQGSADSPSSLEIGNQRDALGPSIEIYLRRRAGLRGRRECVAPLVREEKCPGQATGSRECPVRETSSQLMARSGARLVRLTRAGEVAAVMLSFLSTRVCVG